METLLSQHWVTLVDVVLTIMGMVGTAFFYTVKISKIVGQYEADKRNDAKEIAQMKSDLIKHSDSFEKFKDHMVEKLSEISRDITDSVNGMRREIFEHIGQRLSERGGE